jgi:glucosylceramidase
MRVYSLPLSSLLSLLFFLSLCIAQDTGRNVQVIQTAQAGQYLQDMGTIRLDYNIQPVPTCQDSISIDANTRYQKILGFGTSFTESSAYTFSKQSAANQQKIINAYWGTDYNTSNAYTLARIPIGSCDYSLNTQRTYDDTWGDESLSNFSIEYDKAIILPYITQAYKASGNNIKFIATPWSPPAWMKTNGNLHGGGNLATQYYQTMANYMSKFITAYGNAGVPIWGVTPQNEPEYGPANYPGCLFTPQMEANYIKNNLGPTLASQHPNVNILGYDHNRDDIYTWAQTFYNDPQVTQYLWGIAFHWYASQPDFNNVESTHNLNPGKGLLLTEAAECNTGQQDWAKGEQFGYDMINDLNVWAQGFIQWNSVLIDNGQGMWGPFEGENGVNTCQPPIVILNNEVVFKPSYYYIGQISRYLPPGSVRIGATVNFNSQNLYTTVFMNPNSDVVIVIMNSNDWYIDLNISDYGRTMIPRVPAHGILTLIYPSWSNYDQ